jgi:L-asparagine oxygenase
MQTQKEIQETQEQTEEEQQPKATVGGLPWDFLPSVNRDAWLREIKDRRFPGEDLQSWISFMALADEIASRYLTKDIRSILEDFSRAGSVDAFVLDNLPVDQNLGPTPADGERPAQKRAVSEMVIAGVVQQMKRQILSYRQEKKGAAFHQLVPILGEELKQSNVGRAKFGFHTDNANIHYRRRQEGLALFGLRNEKDVATLLITIDDIKQHVPPSLILKLRFPIYRFPNPLSFDFGGWSVLSEPRPIIWRNDSGLDRISLPRSEFDQPNPEADRAVKEFREVLDSFNPRRVVLSPGRFLAFRDSRVLHGRDTVTGDRWVQRVYFSPSLEAQRAATRSDPREFSFDARLLMLE